RMLLRSDKRLNAPTPAESRVYRSEKWKIQAPEEPPWDFNVLKAISLRRSRVSPEENRFQNSP
ncbi:MAG: hypothetical protein ACHQIM_18395, partial [Sphingobacteriales bacterium]